MLYAHNVYDLLVIVYVIPITRICSRKIIVDFITGKIKNFSNRRKANSSAKKCAKYYIYDLPAKSKSFANSRN